ncbi:Vacuolar protein sorting-associated protein 53-like protein [Aphelenchoides besseyi]|nr:Vacuolar protein sorting-associated protein 53-like protein [Aphelenchoides besseyi]
METSDTLPEMSDEQSAESTETVRSKSPQYSTKVMAILDEITESEFYKPNLDLTALINKLFPTEQSLSLLDSVVQRIDDEVKELDVEIGSLVENHGTVTSDGLNAINTANESMIDLKARIERIRGKTLLSETSVLDMTRDITQLDVAKKNLTSSITCLHHLHLLLTGLNSMTQWMVTKRYGDIASELPAVLNVLTLFDGYMRVPHIAHLTQRVHKLKEKLSVQVSADLQAAFQSGQANAKVSDMCKVVAILGGKIESDFRAWFINLQLGEYRLLFADNEDCAWIDKIDQRYQWFVSKLAELERNGTSKLFPSSWEMGRRLTMEFCEVTRQSLDRLMSKRRLEIEWKLLAHAINHTIMFENLLCKRFPAKDEWNFEKVIWSIFNNYMNIFVNAQSKNLSQFLEDCATKIRNGEERPVRDTSTHAFPLPSSADFFLLLKKIITESTKLCAEPNMLLQRLVDVFKQCLRGYGHGCLTAFMPMVVSSSATTSSILQNLMREETAVRLTPDQQFFCCCLLATSDWCAETTNQLQEKLRQRLPNVDMSQEMELFYSISNNALQTLVQDAEISCDAALQAMTKINWVNVETVGDESAYVSAIRKHLRSIVPLIRDYFSDRRKYFAHFCLKLATQIVNKFLGAIFRCKPLTVTGAEQLLLDTHSLKTFLLSMPSVGSSVVIKPPTPFTAAVIEVMTKAEMVLKVVMADVSKPDDFILNYARMLPKSDYNELQKILEMRAMKRADIQNIIHLYRTKIEGHVLLPPNQATSSSIPYSFSTVVDGIADNSMRRLEKLVKKKL